VQVGSAHREWYANGNSNRRLEASWCRSLLAVEFSILELCPASLRGPRLWRHGGLSSEVAGFADRLPPVPLIAASLSLLPSFALTPLDESEAHPLLISKTLPTLSSALPSAPISSSAPNPPLTPLIAPQRTAHSPHHRSISCNFIPQNRPSTPQLTRILRKTLHAASLPRTACGGPRVRWAWR
jgi:hypothetical protein